MRRAWRPAASCFIQNRDLDQGSSCIRQLLQLVTGRRLCQDHASAGTGDARQASPQQPVLSKQFQQTPQGPSASQLRLNLQQQGEGQQSIPLGDHVMVRDSTNQALQKGGQCTEGCSHEEQQSKHAAANMGSQSAFRTMKEQRKRKSLAIEAPDVAASWHPEGNCGTPDDYTAGSHHLAMWKCSTCGESWTAGIQNRANHHTGCPHCYKLRRGYKADGTRTSHPTLKESGHSMMSDSQWDTEANKKDGFFPDKIKLHSRKHINWVCHKCPLGHLHTYKAKPNNRAVHNSGRPFCSGKELCECNSLQTLFPQSVEEWDYDRDEGTPADYASSSDVVVWWKSAKQGKWQQEIGFRTIYLRELQRRQKALR